MISVEVSTRPTAVRWRILAWIVVASIVAYILRFNLSVAAPAMMRDLGLSEAQLGVVLGALAWSYGLFQAPGGLLGERMGPRRSMTLMYVAWDRADRRRLPLRCHPALAR